MLQPGAPSLYSRADLVRRPSKMVDQLPRTMRSVASQRPLRVCVAYSRLPFPMMRGDQLTIAHLLSYLNARGHEVDFYTLDSGGELSAEQRGWLEKMCRKVRIFPHRLTNVISGIARAFISGLPIQVGYFDNKKLVQAVRKEAAKGAYDLVYCYYIRSAPVVPDGFVASEPGYLSGNKVVSFLALQLSQTLNTRRIYENETSWAKRLFYWVEWRRLRTYESRIWSNFTKTVLIGQRDVADVKDACRHSGGAEIDNWVLSAHGTDIQKFRVARPEEITDGRVVFSGSMRYQPNVQAAIWFIENCWDSIRERMPGAELYIVGQSPAAALRAFDGTKNITITGTVEDIGSYIRSASVCVNPMLAAGGMQNKLIEYMACGKAIVATSIANEGIGAPSGTVVIADDEQSFIDATSDLLKDKHRAETLGKSAREYVAREWTWEYQFDKLEKEFYRALDG